MNNIRVEEECARHVPVALRPFGYVLVRSRNPSSENPSYWGEIELRKETSVKLCYTIESFDQEEKKYEVHLFSDREFRWPLLSAHISFIDHDSRLIQTNIVFLAQNLSMVPDELLCMIHIIVYRCIGELLPIVLDGQPRPMISAIMEIGYIFGFNSRMIDDFEEETSTPLRTLISVTNLLLG